MEDPDCVGSPTDTGNYVRRKLRFDRENLLACLFSDNGLKLTHHRWIWRGPDDRADDVIAVVDIGHPIANRLTRCILQRSRSARHWNDLGAEEAHAVHVQRLAAHVLFTHVHDAVEAEPRAHRRRCDSVLTRTRL